MYELETSLTADKGGFLLPKGGRAVKEKPRIGTGGPTIRVEVFNGNYAPSGHRLGNFDRPWNVCPPDDNIVTFATHAEAIAHALQWVLQEARK